MPSKTVAMAVKNRHFMPASGDLVDANTVIFDKRHRLKHLESLLVLAGRIDPGRI